MLPLAFWLLCGAALLGGALMVMYLRGTAARHPPPMLLAAHAAWGTAALAALIAAIGQGLPRTRMGTAGFGVAAAFLLSAALVCGLLIARAAWRGRRPVELLVGLHAGLAIAGLCLLLALVALG